MIITEKEFTEIVRQNKSTIYTVCYMYAKDSDEADDLFQDIVINMWTGIKSFAGQSDIRTWIWRVSLNTCISSERKHKHHSSVSILMNANLYEDRDEDTVQIQMLHERISRLRPFDRAIVLLWLENMTYEEIGRITGISTKNVSVRLYRIKRELENMSNTK